LSTRDQELVRKVVAGDAAATRELVTRLLDVVTREVGFVLLRRAAPSRRDPRQERDDLAQEVLVGLLSDRAQELARWDPARGRSLDSFVQLIARRRALRLLSGGRGNPWSNEPVAPDDLEELHEGAARDVEELEARNELASVLDRLHTHMSDRDAELFELVFVEERTPEEVCEQMSMTRAALNTWRHRLRKLAKQLAEHVLRPGGSP
jgi:RNA polymerase sigma-70 factor (ECF subfamily)